MPVESRLLTWVQKSLFSHSLSFCGYFTHPPLVGKIASLPWNALFSTWRYPFAQRLNGRDTITPRTVHRVVTIEIGLQDEIRGVPDLDDEREDCLADDVAVHRVDVFRLGGPGIAKDQGFC